MVTPIAFVLFVTPATGFAQSASDVAAMRQELGELKAEQARTAARIAGLEDKLNGLEGASPISEPPQPLPPQAAAAKAISMVREAGAVQPLDVAGDIRIRYESNFGDRDTRNRSRFALRARLRGSYAVTDWLTAGGQLTTGDPDDPNSSDVTLSNFDDDLSVSLDQAWLRAKFGNLQISGGKIPLPFKRTDMVWDGDVYPEGLSFTYETKIGALATAKAAGLYFVIDEAPVGEDSRMIGGQIGVDAKLGDTIKFETSAGYYDYRLSSAAGGDSGDFRSNRFVNGRYLSDFNLLDVIASATWTGPDKNWPLRIIGNYVHNFGATTPSNSGYSIGLAAGRITEKGNWRFGLGYAQTGVDAVLAAFSEDNTTLASNYVQHNFSVDYVLRPHLILNGTFYRYKPKSAIDAGPNDPNHWLNRLRINLLAEF